MNILHITNAYPTSSTPEYGVFIKEQIESISSNIVHNDIIFINARDNGFLEYIRSVKKVNQIAKDFKIIHCHHLYSFFVLFLSMRWIGRRVVLSFLNDWTREIKTNSIKPIAPFLCHFGVLLANVVIFKSPVPKHLTNKKNCINLPNGVDTCFFNTIDKNSAKSMLSLNKDTHYILFVSSKNLYREQKRYDLFKETINTLKSRNPSLSIEPLLLCNVERTNIPYFFNAASIHLLTSDYEGSPNSVKEALACGTPVVSRDVGNVSDMMSDISECHVLPLNSTIEDLTFACEKVLNSNPSPDKIRSKFLTKELSKEQIAQRLINIYSNNF